MKENDINSPLHDRVEVDVEHLKPGTLLYNPTYDFEGNLIHAGYIPFTEDEIEALLASGIQKIYYTANKNPRFVEKKAESPKGLLDYIDEEIYEGPRTISSGTQKQAITVMEKILKVIDTDSDEPNPAIFEEAKTVVDNIIHDLDNSDSDMVNLIDLQEYDDYTYTHCLNVGIIAIYFARKLRLDEELIKDIGLGGFLHDIGKVKVPTNIINKSGELSPEEFEVVKHHAQIGYEIISYSESLSDTVKKIVLLHHEKHNGTGYPYHLKEEEIDACVMITALADYYDALTTERSYKKAFSNRETLALIQQKAGEYFKRDMAHRFAREMLALFKESNFYLIGNYVLLNTTEVAQIVSKDSELTSRPGVEIVRNIHGKILTKPFFVDLNRDGSRHIVQILHDFKLSDEESD